MREWPGGCSRVDSSRGGARRRRPAQSQSRNIFSHTLLSFAYCLFGARVEFTRYLGQAFCALKAHVDLLQLAHPR